MPLPRRRRSFQQLTEDNVIESSGRLSHVIDGCEDSNAEPHNSFGECAEVLVSVGSAMQSGAHCNVESFVKDRCKLGW